jgi:hypothetical protein
VPRSHARILVSIWTDTDFRALSPEAQRTYMLLLSQGSLNNAGVLPLTVKRWAAGCNATTTGDVEKALAELDEHRYVAVDEDTEELLVRSFIRNDGISKQPQMLKSALKEAVGIESPRLRAVLAQELRRLGRDDCSFTADQIDPGFPPDPPNGGGSPIQAPRSLPEACPQPAATLPEDSAQAAELRRGRGRGSSSSSVSSSSVVGASKRGTRIPDDFAVSQAMVVWARSETPDVDGRFETQQFIDYWAAKAGKDAVKLDWTRTWQTWMRRAQRDAATRGPRLRSVPAPVLPADPADAFTDLRNRAAALEASRLIRASWIEPAQPPSDQTPPRQWLHDRAVEWIDAHEQEIRAALTERKTG